MKCFGKPKMLWFLWSLFLFIVCLITIFVGLVFGSFLWVISLGSFKMKCMVDLLDYFPPAKWFENTLKRLNEQ